MDKIKQFFSDHDILILTLVASAFSIGSFLYYYHAGLITAYGDSRGHLDIARRVVDSLTPGVAQLGGYWLPLLHILMLPTIWNNFMWQSGLSGSIPSMVAFVLTVVFMYKLVFYIAKDKFSAVIAASVIMLNANLLYMQVVPMTESLFVCTITIFMYFFYKWFQEKNISDLILAAFFLILSSLNRYEGWGLVIASSVLLVLYWAQNKFSKKIEGVIIMFSTLSFLGIFMWLLWGAVIFHDPLEFMHNALSAGNQTSIVDANWTGVNNIGKATMVNVYAIIHTSGGLLLGLCVLGFIIFFIRKKKHFLKSENLILLLLIVPMLFDILTVYTGKVPIEVPELSKISFPGNYFNIRYALYSLPFIAIFSSIISKKRIVQVVIFSFILINYSLLGFCKNSNIVVLTGAGISLKDGREQAYEGAVDWFKHNYDGGLVLASTGSNDGLMLETGIDQKFFITEGTYKYWDESLKDPSEYATWVIFSNNNPRDAVNKNVNKKTLFENFEIVEKYNNLLIMKKIGTN